MTHDYKYADLREEDRNALISAFRNPEPQDPRPVQEKAELSVLLDEIETEYKAATKPEHFYSLALLVPALAKALRRAMDDMNHMTNLSSRALRDSAYGRAERALAVILTQTK